jgi:hypothetical protein
MLPRPPSVLSVIAYRGSSGCTGYDLWMILLAKSWLHTRKENDIGTYNSLVVRVLSRNGLHHEAVDGRTRLALRLARRRDAYSCGLARQWRSA